MSQDKNNPQTQVQGVGGQASPAGNNNLQTYIPSGAMASDRPMGRLMIIAGPGQGQTRQIYSGSNSIGRDPTQNRVSLDFDDTFMSRHEHAVLAVDAIKRTMTVHDRGKANRVQVNGEPLIGERVITDKDLVQIGRTFVKFELV